MKPLEKIVGTAFQGGTVELDGRHFHGCEFSDCTLLLRGLGGYELKECKIHEGCRIETPALPGLSEFLWRSFWKNAH